MTTRVARWGHSLAVRIPKAFAQDVQLTEGAEVENSVSDGQLVLTPVGRAYDLRRLVQEITPENRHGETDWGSPVGREIW